MYYSAIGALALSVIILENFDVIFKLKKNIEDASWKAYKRLVYALIFFYVTDLFWGIVEHHRYVKGEYIESQFYFFAMALCVHFWTQYVYTYLNEKSWFGTFLLYAGRFFCAGLTALVLINCFTPVLFTIDNQGGYHATLVRGAMLVIQIILLNMLSLFAGIVMLRRRGEKTNRYRTLANYSFIVAVFLFIQIWFPLLPLCSVANMLGMSLLRSFVVNDEKEEYKKKLEESLFREKEQLSELKTARTAAYTDALTGVNSKSAFVEMEMKKNEEIRGKNAKEFAVAVFDLNGLKVINDTYGHEKGDEFIKEACKIICDSFKHSPVYRIGGDEFVALLENEDFSDRLRMQKEFNEMMSMRKGRDDVVVAMGLSDFIEDSDYTFSDVFRRADQKMYENKRILKKE